METVAEHFDLIVIGSGPAGEKAAAQAAYFGKQVALIERGLLGGAGINTGTVPTKTLRESALYFSGLKQRGLYGIDYSLREGLTVEDFMHRKDAVISWERDKIALNLEAHKVTLIRGVAGFEDTRTIVVLAKDEEPRRLTATAILIATGSRPHRTPDIPYDDHFVFDSDSILSMDRIPKSMVVVGGGVIGCEYASIFAALGVQVALVDGRDRLLPFLDAEISDRLAERFTSLGVEVILGERMAKLERTPAGVSMTLKSGKVIERETTLFAAGRRGAVDGLNLERAGLELNARGTIEVNAVFQTTVPHIYAAGDVVGFPALVSTSMEQGRVAMCHAFDFPYKKRVASTLPMGIYTIPEISAVGETEETCREKDIPHCVGRARYANNTRGQITGDSSGLLKLVFRRNNKVLIGVHIIGEGATDLVHLGSAIIESGGTIDSFIHLVFNYPTLSEMYKYAAYDGLGNLAGHKLREG
ncbi:MAG: Si-specific NAD(P)(+) transhydrogenase [Candidatus Acidiferrales bacterium]